MRSVRKRIRVVYLLLVVLKTTSPPNAIAYPKIWSGVIWDPKIRTEPLMRRMSYVTRQKTVHTTSDTRHTLKTPARVRTSPLPTPMRKTAATLRQNAIAALERRIMGPIR